MYHVRRFLIDTLGKDKITPSKVKEIKPKDIIAFFNSLEQQGNGRPSQKNYLDNLKKYFSPVDELMKVLNTIKIGKITKYAMQTKDPMTGLPSMHKQLKKQL